MYICPVMSIFKQSMQTQLMNFSTLRFIHQTCTAILMIAVHQQDCCTGVWTPFSCGSRQNIKLVQLKSASAPSQNWWSYQSWCSYTWPSRPCQQNCCRCQAYNHQSCGFHVGPDSESSIFKSPCDRVRLEYWQDTNHLIAEPLLRAHAYVTLILVYMASVACYLELCHSVSKHKVESNRGHVNEYEGDVYMCHQLVISS